MKDRDPRDNFHDVVLEELAKVPTDAQTACMPAAKGNANPEHCFNEMYEAHLWDEATVQGLP